MINVMKNILLLMIAVVAMTSCGNKTKTNAPDTDSTIVSEIPDTLHTVEAVERQVDAVYAYWNDLREHFDENRPSVDEQFGSKEWWRVRQEVAAIDRESESGSFFNFDDEGPLDPWTYDCYEGTVSANDIQVKFQPNGMAEVRFLVKDAVTLEGIPIRWLMRMENGQWRVANIFFEKDDNYDILMNMRAYVDDGKYHKDFDINKYLQEMKRLVAKEAGTDEDETSFDAYGLLDIDRDGMPEVYVRDKEHFYNAVFSIADGKPTLLAASFNATEIYFFEHGVGAQGGCGTGCMMSDLTLIKNSRAVFNICSIDEYDMDGELAASSMTKDDKKISKKEYDKLYAQLGEPVDLSAMLHEIE
jgi:hypothetical protein